MLERIADGLHTLRDPEQTLLGLRLGTRMTVVRLAGGGLFLHSPVHLTPELRDAVDALGAVRHIVCPNLYHHLYAGEWAAAYPGAIVLGPAALAKKRPDLTLAGTLDAQPEWQGTLVPVPIGGSRLEETVFVHPASRTLVSSDLTENFRSMDHFFTRQYLKINGTYGTAGWPRVLRFLYRDKQAAKDSVARLLDHDFDRVLLAHGEPIDSGGKDAVRQTFTFLG